MSRTRGFRKCAALCAAAVIALWASPAARAATAEIAAEVRRTLTVADERFGGCMVALSAAPSEKGLDCPTRWVSFSCTGVYASKSGAPRMFDQAQLAFVTGRTARVWVDDSKKHNGHCYASRIDVEAAPRD